MKQKMYNKVTGLIFAVVAVVHVLRVLQNWPVNLGGMEVPMVGSYVGAVVAGFLAYSAYKLMK
jgi:hypothetical protein